MHHADRAIFELQRGRPVWISGPHEGNGDGRRGALVAAVETLDEAALDRVRALGERPTSLVVTAHRARAMAAPVDGVGDALALTVPDGVGADRVLETAVGEPALDLGTLRAAGALEHAGLSLARLGELVPAVLAAPAYGHGPLRAALDQGEILGVPLDSVSQALASPGVDVTFVSEAPVPLAQAEDARFVLFRETPGLFEHVAVLIGSPDAWPDPVPVRLHSACLTGDLFGSLRCDCGEQLRGSLASFKRNGGGVLVYLAQEGRGIGLGNKFRTYTIQQAAGLDTVDSDCSLGFGPDERRYPAAVSILKRLGVERVRLLTNNPQKLRALEEGGIQVADREPLHGTLNRHNLPYVRAKVQRAGHWLGDMLAGGTSTDAG